MHEPKVVWGVSWQPLGGGPRKTVPARYLSRRDALTYAASMSADDVARVVKITLRPKLEPWIAVGRLSQPPAVLGADGRFYVANADVGKLVRVTIEELPNERA